jgi:DNA-directed RNA polymerase subunit K/omega
MTLPAIVEVGLAPLSSRGGTLSSRFHIAAVAFQRARQLKQGARPRVEAFDHKVATLALLEVMADTVSWSLEEPKARPLAAA